MPATFAELKTAHGQKPLTAAAVNRSGGIQRHHDGDLFPRFIRGLPQVDPNHLNLGIRYQGVPPLWLLQG